MFLAAPARLCDSDALSAGNIGLQIGAVCAQWIAFATAVAGLIFYAYDTVKATTGWEEVYVCIVERELG